MDTSTLLNFNRFRLRYEKLSQINKDKVTQATWIELVSFADYDEKKQFSTCPLADYHVLSV